jgi:hypothetical protein
MSRKKKQEPEPDDWSHSQCTEAAFFESSEAKEFYPVYQYFNGRRHRRLVGRAVKGDNPDELLIYSGMVVRRPDIVRLDQVVKKPDTNDCG